MSKSKTMEGIELQIEQKPGHSATLWSEVCPGSESIFGIGNFNCNLWIPAKIKGRYEILFEFMLRGHRIDKTTTLYWKVLFYFFFTPAWNGKRGEGGGGGKKCPPVAENWRRKKVCSRESITFWVRPSCGPMYGLCNLLSQFFIWEHFLPPPTLSPVPVNPSETRRYK